MACTISNTLLMTRMGSVMRRTTRNQSIGRWSVCTNKLTKTAMTNNDQKMRHPLDSKNTFVLFQKLPMVLSDWITIYRNKVTKKSWFSFHRLCDVIGTHSARRTFVVHALEMGWSPQRVILHWTWRLWHNETIHCTDWQDQEEDDGNKLLMIWNRWTEREMAPMLFPFFCMGGNSKEQMIIFVEMIDKRTYTRWG